MLGKTKRRASALITAVFCAIAFCMGAAADGYECVHGYRTFGDKVMNYGVGNYGNNRRYFWMGGFDSFYARYIRNAVEKWVNTTDAVGVTTSISIRETSVRENALFEFVNRDLGLGVLGMTSFYMYDERVPLNSEGALTANYGWARCDISVPELNGSGTSSQNGSQKESTIAHELGHAMGLSHQNNRRASIMCQTGYGRTAVRADRTDLLTINHLYG
ncbi:MAG TPA: matrixin family metalloprotease [Firmicutes bacterium]|nr:matrixin family metalloprotease [Bacillota bacterium]